MSRNPTRLYVTRHGQTDANLQRRVQGQGDTPLNATGVAQAGELADYFAGKTVDAIVSSDLPRARQTAELLAERLKIPVSYHPELRARRMGDYENKTHAELVAADPENFKRLKHDPDFVPPGGGESTHMLMERMAPFIQATAERHAGGAVIVLSHHKICQLIVAKIAGGEVTPIPNARPAIVIYDETGYRIQPQEVPHGAA